MNRVAIGVLWGLSAVLAGAAFAPANVISNPGFESGLPPWTGAPVPSIANTAVQSDVTHSGSGAAQFTVVGGGASGSTMLFQSFPVQQQITSLSFWYRMDAVAATSLRLDLALEGGGGPFFVVPPIQADTWVQFVAPPQALLLPNRNAIRLYALTQQGGPLPVGGRIWVDDVVVTGVPAPGAASALACGGLLALGRRRRFTAARVR